MTLVLAAAHKDNFAIMSCDSIIAEYYYNLITMERLDDLETRPLSTTRDKGKNKAIKLTNYVLLGIGGISELAWDIQREMQSRVYPDYDLKECLQVAKEVVEVLRSNENQAYREFLDVQGTGLCLMMSGFYISGGTGFAVFVSGPNGGQFIEQKHTDNQKTGYIYGMIPPVTDYNEHLHELFELPPGKPINMRNVTEQMAIIQNAIYTNHPDKITSDMNTHVLFKPGNSVGKKKNGKKHKTHAGKTPLYKYFEVETCKENVTDAKIIRKDPPEENPPKIQQYQARFNREEVEYAVVCQAIVSDLGKLIMNIGMALKSDDADKTFKAIGEYIGEVKKLDEKFSIMEPTEKMRFYHKDFVYLMELHVKLSYLLYNTRITMNSFNADAIVAVVEDIKKAAMKVTVSINNTAR